MELDLQSVWCSVRRWWHLVFVFSSLCVDYGIPHPQCLDFRAPFNPGGLDFCKDYSTFGCCTKALDLTINDKYQVILQKLRPRTDVTLSCKDFVKSILCLQCSPYAAHLYEAEATRVIQPFPSLCSDTANNKYNSSVNSYCQDFYTNCSSEVIKFVTDEEETLKSAVTQRTFCAGLQNSDANYCYPGILANTSLNAELSNAKSSKEGCVCLEEYGSKLRNPVFVRHAGDGSNMLYVGEQGGLIYIYENKTKVEEPFLNIINKVTTSANTGEERGLLGMTFHPKYAENRKFYVYYSPIAVILPFRTREMIKVSEFKASATNKYKADPATEREIISVEQPYWNHNGGEIIFGEDGYLYVFLGDGGSAGDPHNNSQDTSSLLGKILRLDVDVEPERPYNVPADNPFVNNSLFRPEIYAYGFRNPWRCSKDRGNPDIKDDPDKGRMICGDVGQSKYEEVDIVEKGGNYGWNAREGMECYHEKICGKIGDEVYPIYAYPHSVGRSVTGGYVYRGCQNPKLKGSYVFGDFYSSKLFLLKENKTAGNWGSSDLGICTPDVCNNGLTSSHPPHITSFGEDEYGEIFMTTMDMGKAIKGIRDHGKFFKIVDPNQRGNPEKCKSAISYVKEREKNNKSTTVTTQSNQINAPIKAEVTSHSKAEEANIPLREFRASEGEIKKPSLVKRQPENTTTGRLTEQAAADLAEPATGEFQMTGFVKSGNPDARIAAKNKLVIPESTVGVAGKPTPSSADDLLNVKTLRRDVPEKGSTTSEIGGGVSSGGSSSRALPAGQAVITAVLLSLILGWSASR